MFQINSETVTESGHVLYTFATVRDAIEFILDCGQYVSGDMRDMLSAGSTVTVHAGFVMQCFVRVKG